MFAFCSFNAIQTFHAVYDLTFSSSFSSSSSSSKSSSSLILLILLAPVLPLLFPALFPVQSLYGRPKPSCGASCRASFSGSPKRIKWKMCGVSCQCQGNKKFLGLHNLEIVPNCLQARTPGGQCELIVERCSLHSPSVFGFIFTVGHLHPSPPYETLLQYTTLIYRGPFRS